MALILIGGGKIAYFLARQLSGKNHRLILISSDPVEARWLSEQLTTALVILGDGTDPEILAEAGAAEADIVVALTPHDQDNLVACQLARQMYSVPWTIALANDPDNEAIFAQLGISATFCVPSLIATLIEQRAGYHRHPAKN
jgi:trk system potassium uptake protein TrkA